MMTDTPELIARLQMPGGVFIDADEKDTLLSALRGVEAAREALEKIAQQVELNLNPALTDPNNMRVIRDALNDRIDLAREALAAPEGHRRMSATLDEMVETALRAKFTGTYNPAWDHDLLSALRGVEAARRKLRAIELCVDGLNTKAFKQKPDTQAALDAIKAHCRAALSEEVTPK